MRAQRWLARLDAAFSVLGGLASVWLAYLILREGITLGWQVLLVLVFWVLVAYLVLPRLHRILTGVYVPDYFIGRTRTADGLLGDPVNLALLGSAAQVHHAMERAGWTRADELTLANGWRTVTSTLRRRSYPDAPVSPLLLFRRTQDFTYQQEVAGSPSRRHHVRFWKCPDGWLLPGGFSVDWLAAGTYDRSVGLSLFTLQFTHRIDRDVDVERDHIIASVTASSPRATVTVLPDFFSGYHSRNGGGDLINTDGDLPVLDLTALPDEPGDPTLAGGARAVLPMVPAELLAIRRRPTQTIFGVAVTAARGVIYLALAGLAFTGGWSSLGVAPQGPAVGVATGVVFLLGAVFDLALATMTWFGGNLARLALCALSVTNIATTFLARTVQDEHGPLHAGLLPLAVSVLVLLALSSEAARAWATGRPSRPELVG
jgi:hypothetical protein